MDRSISYTIKQASPFALNSSSTTPPLSTTERLCESSALPAGRVAISTKQNAQRANILRTFSEKNLSFRSVTCSNEKKYLNNPRKRPRPTYMVAEEVPVAMRILGQETIAIANPRTLSAYKQNAATAQLVSGELQPDDLSIKCLPNLSSLQEKMRELAERMNWELYQDASSGHLTLDGTFTQPKPGKRICNSFRPLEHSELLTEYYEKNQIVSYCVSTNDPRDISTVVAEKHSLEQNLGLATLPITVYSEQSGSIQVCFEEELQLTANLAKNEPLQDDYARSLAIDPALFKKTLALLSWPERTRFLNDFGAYYTPPPQGIPTNLELKKLVTTPSEYSGEKLKAYHSKGTRIDFNLSDSHSLMDEFLSTEIDRYLINTLAFNPNDTLALKARSLFTELIRCGSRMSPKKIEAFHEGDMSYLPHLIDQFVALGILPDINYRYDARLFYGYPDSIGTTLIYQQFSTLPIHDIQNQLCEIMIQPFTTHLTLPDNYEEKLLMLFYYGADPRPFKQQLANAAARAQEKYSNYYLKMCGQRTPDEHADAIIALWENRQSNPLFINWPGKIEQAKKKIAVLKESLAPHPRPANATQNIHQWQQAQPIVAAFQQSPLLRNPGDNEETVLTILDHYYRRPGPKQMLDVLRSGTFPDVWKKAHSCNHVLRARNNVHWYIELLEQFNVIQFTDDEKALLALAAVYHDAAAEDVDKKEEERQSAHYFTRDLADHYPTELVNKIGEALERKEDDVHCDSKSGLDDRLHSYMHVLRFGDRMDFIRCSSLGKTFPDWSDRQVNAGEFNVHLLDIPPQQKAAFSTVTEQKTGFQNALEAAMHGAVDLASVTGGVNGDRRPQGSYAEQYRLRKNGDKIQHSFEKTPQPVSRMERFLDDNVRRMIARLAGIDSCDPTDHPTCRANTKTGVSHGIHNGWHDLAQIQIPEAMSRLEKMQCGYNLAVLSENTRRNIEAEVARLKKEGIAMSLGTLTQKTLKSPAAVTVLANRQIDVITEDRMRGWDDSNNPIVQKMAVPVRLQ